MIGKNNYIITSRISFPAVFLIGEVNFKYCETNSSQIIIKNDYSSFFIKSENMAEYSKGIL